MICERTTSDKGILGQIKYAVEEKYPPYASPSSSPAPPSTSFFLVGRTHFSHSLEIALHVPVYELFSFPQPLFDNLLHRDSVHNLRSLPSQIASQAHPLLLRQRPLRMETLYELGQASGLISSSSNNPRRARSGTACSSPTSSQIPLPSLDDFAFTTTFPRASRLRRYLPPYNRTSKWQTIPGIPSPKLLTPRWAR